MSCVKAKEGRPLTTDLSIGIVVRLCRCPRELEQGARESAHRCSSTRRFSTSVLRRQNFALPFLQMGQADRFLSGVGTVTGPVFGKVHQQCAGL